MRRIIVTIASVALLACGDPVDQEDAGYGDGYAVGYNTACEIRATLVAGTFDNADYSRGYARGQTDGVIACNADKRAGRAER